MESYGELLRTTRESKQLDLDRASREISIEKRYLAGLEEEDNSVFPGDAAKAVGGIGIRERIDKLA